MTTTTPTEVNGLDLQALQKLAEQCGSDPAAARAKFQVATRWQGGTRSESSVDSWELAGQKKAKSFRFRADEPAELLGGNSAPNPQEYLMASLNACLLVGYVAGCAMKGIQLSKLEIRSEGELDLRGFLGLAEVPPGYPAIRYSVVIQGNGTPEDFQQVHEMVQATSPNYFNLSQPVRLEAELIVA